MKIFSPKEVIDIFRHTVDNEGVSMIDIVDRVGEGVAAEVKSRLAPGNVTVVFAGWGTNGAYALSAARKLLADGLDPLVFLFNIGGNRISADCANQKKFLIKEYPKAKFYEITQNFDIPTLNNNCLVIDGLFGVDLDRPLPKSFGLLMRAINESGATIVSIEIPSGLFSVWNTNNSPSRDIIHATVTLAVEFPALAYFMEENIPLIGDWKILEVGLSREAIKNSAHTYYLITHRDIKHILRQREKGASKKDFGSALICAGSYGMMGAAVLAAKGCLRAGAGKVFCYAPQCGNIILQTAVPCAMFIPDSGEKTITRIVPEREYRSIGIGPGIGVSNSTITALEAFLKLSAAKRHPLVIDADALNCIAERPIMMNYLPALSVLTPHAGEFDRIFGAQPSSEARLRKALEIAAYHNIILVLKSHYTAVVRPDGKVHINSSGTPALATPGSGDVLTGVITSLIAQGYTPETAAIIGVYVHGLAGEIAEEEHGVYGVTASDIADCIGKSIKTIMG